MEHIEFYYYLPFNKLETAEVEEIRNTYFNNEISLLDLLKYSEDSRYIFRVLKNEDKIVVAYLIGQKIQDEFELYQIAVNKNFLDKGIGSKLLTYFLKECHDLFIKTIFLEVRKSNKIAIEFYKKFDFEFIYERKKYYFDKEDCLCYKKEIKEETYER